MKKISISICLIIMVMFVSIIPAYGASHSFTLTINPTSKTANLGDTVTIDIGIADID